MKVPINTALEHVGRIEDMLIEIHEDCLQDRRFAIPWHQASLACLDLANSLTALQVTAEAEKEKTDGRSN